MRAVIQRVSKGSVSVHGEIAGAIGPGLLVFLGVGRGDTEADVDYLVEKTCGVRIFEDLAGKMNLNVVDSRGAILVVSQFTLYGDIRKGRRPSFDEAAPPSVALLLYESFVAKMRSRGILVETGVFQAAMRVELTNEGPVTILCDSRRAF